MTTDPVTLFLDAVTSGSGVPLELYAPQAVLDATVPHWRLEVHRPAAISARLSGWYAHSGHLSELVRTPVPGGEVVRFTLAWTENGGPMAARQVHLFDVEGGAITHQDAWCGGRWEASLQAEIEVGLQSAREGS